MQARIELRRFPSTLVTIVLAALLALLLGLALGYAIKPAATGPAHTIVVPAGQVTNPSDSACQFVDKHKAC